MQHKKGKAKSEIQKDEVLQAVIVTDTFNRNFFPVPEPYCLLPLVNKCLLEYTLEHLHLSGIEEIIVFCTSHVNQIRELVKRKEKSLVGTLITLIVSDGCYSFGDVMRDLDGKAVIRNDFILVSGDVVSNINLLSALKSFKKINSMDSGAVALVLYKKKGQSKSSWKEDLIVAYECDSKKLLMHQTPQDNQKKVNIPMENILLYSKLEICAHLASTGIMICSPAVPPLFSDNFDFQTQEHFIKGVLINEEILDCRLYCSVVDDIEYGISVKDWPSYQIASRDIVQRWVHPFVPSYKYRRNNIYLAEDVLIGKTSVLKQQVVIGEGSSIGENTQLSHCIIGRNCTIGSNVRLEKSYLFDNVKIEDNCEVRLSVLSYNTGVGEHSKLLNGCLLGTGVLIGNKTCLSGVKLPSAGADEVDDGNNDSDEEEVPKFKCESEQELDSDESDSESENDVDSVDGQGTPPMDDTSLFYTEVVDSLLRGYEEKLVCDNLTLEINSSRYAYNVTVKEVNFYMVKAILVVKNKPDMDMKSFHTHMMSKINYFLPLFKNYIKNESAQQDCLDAFEEFAEENESLSVVAGKLLHKLYDKDILSEDIVTKWFNKLEPSSLRKSVEPFVKWLLEADEESEEDD
ncbi:translation initiation factor eIF-2B subunit epsilon [Diaphorina citri]|uniref:Translation initiation factor eIF2B subunit epsilon n=1 Tax=Diaphorina citri TaxID=121845 RepID=A0A1S3D7K2_DIACI|nr:translation initiation factor eIF-2B subunit epsilon [Diaphorina citri]